MGTANTLLSRAILRLNELSTTAPIRWTRPELLAYFNDGLCEFNLITANYVDTHSVAIDNTAVVWSLPEGVVAPISARTSGSGYLIKQTIEDLDKEYDWENPSYQRLYPKYWAPLGFEKIIVTPRPNNPMTVYVEALTQFPLVTDAAVDLIAWIKPEYEGAIEDFIVSRAMFKEAGAEATQALAFYNRYLGVARELSTQNIIRRYPSWAVAPEAMLSETTVRGRTS